MFYLSDAQAGTPERSRDGAGGGLAAAPLELIEREIEELAAQITAGSARFLELVGEFDRREGWANTGCRSTSEWVAWRCALTPRAAREQVRVARALPDLPLIREGFAAGALSYSKVRALTRVADADSEEDLIELARHATAAQLERMARAARRSTAAEEAAQHREAFLRWSWNDDHGCLEIHAKLAPEDGALFLQALEAAREALRERQLAWAEAEDDRAVAGSGSAEPHAPRDEAGGSAEPPAAPSPSNAECLAALGELALARPPSGFNGVVGGERHQLMVHVDAATLTTDSPGASATGDGCCHLARGPGIAPEVARRIACDSSLVPLVELDGQPIAAGHARRSIPPSTRRALVSRDGYCQFPGCERWRFVDGHHIRHWAHGGQTTLENLVLLCRHHHRLVHEGGYGVARDEHGVTRFFDAAGTPIARSPAPRTGDGRRLPPARSSAYTGLGEHMDLRLCVGAVLAATAAGRPTARAAPAAGVPG